MFERFKNANVLSIDMWVFVVILIIFPQTEAQIQNNIPQYLDIFVVSTGILFSLIGIVVLLCTKLRGYRYFDVYVDCKKHFVSKLWYLMLFLEIISIGFAVLIFGVDYNALLMMCTIVLLSIHLNNSQDLKLQKEAKAEVKHEQSTEMV